MSGPPYPYPSRGIGAIGDFEIGISPIGEIPSFNIWSTIISQYANSPILTSIITSLATALDQTENFESLYDNIWNVATASGYGLDVWGRIVGVSRTLTVSSSTFFGFAQQAPTVDDFGPGGQSPFYSGSPTTSSYSLTDSAFRTLIYAKALANICDGSIPGINSVLLALFPGRGRCYVTDGENMTMTYTFEFLLTAVEVAIVSSSGILPKPVGVAATVVQL
jgi:hypothetical protein